MSVCHQIWMVGSLSRGTPIKFAQNWWKHLISPWTSLGIISCIVTDFYTDGKGYRQLFVVCIFTIF